ncbi:acyltransferase family protein [Bacillus sp. RAR_GA_16]|uniref:acyltransferase family protein n=1 Tax=Bacillus sp. RAR_GA_16 TaxID=2876774 RepID=UPI001CCE2BC7|nr:heparan-alpha-glucosaminide N-acetyltransferase domain-containing protein [Bacillus sp. RAR_GA_16]MCA0172160.1 heparan-alpha-glucosaminide N-acetyltransferase domain-containing protein [Bacillus sp. RAR_GA_16]
MSKAQQMKKKRVYSLDMLRGIIVVLSVFLSTIPAGRIEYESLRHAEWYGVTIIDVILPTFITIFGASMAIAYQRGVKWEKIIKRTVRLIVYGIIFTIIVTWSLDFATLRWTGVLQMFAFLGIVAVIITYFVKSPFKLMLIALLVSSIYGGALLTFGQSCEDQMPQPDCNPSGIIDRAIFGEDHLYHQGERGYDPEGLVTSFSALSNVLFGFAIGKLILSRKETGAWKELLGIGLLVIALSLIWHQFLPYNKRLWTPAFAMLAAGLTSSMLSILYLLFDKGKVDAKETYMKPIVWYLEAFGRNSFLIYFGKFMLASLLIHLTLKNDGENESLATILYDGLASFVPHPQLAYALLNLLFWTIIAFVCHRKRWYLKV